MATAGHWRIALRLPIVLGLLTATSAMGSALFLMYLARPYIAGRLLYEITASAWVLLLGAIVSGVLAAMVGLGFGMVTSRRIRGVIRRIEALLRDQPSQGVRPATDELGALEQAFGHLTLSIDRFVRDSEILARLPQGMIFVGAQGELVDYNAAAEGILGVSLAPYIGKGIWEKEGLLPEGPENHRLRELCEQAMGTAAVVTGGEVKVWLETAFLPAGTDACRLLEVSIQGWQGRDSPGVVIIFQDAAAKQRIREQIRQADQLAFLGGLAAQFSHQVRTPLTTIRGLLELLQTDPPPAEVRQEYFDRIVRGLHRLDRLAASLLSLAHATPTTQRSLDVREVLQDVLPRNVSADYAPSLPAVTGDADLLAEAFTNLFQNALDAAATGGEVTVQVRPAEGPAGLAAAPQGVEVRIRNTGSGLAAELRERIFEPFVSTKPGGTGLGLTIARRIIESHGGRIRVESDGSSWTTFVVELP